MGHEAELEYRFEAMSQAKTCASSCRAWKQGRQPWDGDGRYVRMR